MLHFRQLVTGEFFTSDLTKCLGTPLDLLIQLTIDFVHILEFDDVIITEKMDKYLTWS